MRFPSGRAAQVPPGCVGSTYGALFASLTLAHGAVPLGLYRGRGGGRGALDYVHASPHPDTVLLSDDRVFVLRPAAVAGGAADE